MTNKRTSHSAIYSACLLIAFFSAPVNATKITTGIDEEAKLPYWEARDKGMSIRLVQRLPDQTRAFFLARGFSEAHAEIIAQSCVFQTVYKNVSNESSASPLKYNLQDWVVLHKGKNRKMKLREDWKKEWVTRKASLSSQIAFEWSLVPTQQVFQPGDYNWGMSLFNLKPGENFDLKIVWHQYNKVNSVTIKGIECAPDIHPDPES